MAARFRHRSSRAGDPRLHAHVLVANFTQGADGRYSALDGRQLYAQAKTASCLYQAALRHQLAPLGLEWVVRDNGLSELAEVPTEVLRAFSRRRIEIESRMHGLGTSTPAAGQAATLETRRAKDYGVDAVALVAGWHARAEALGSDAAARDALLHGRITPHEREPVDLAQVAARLLNATGLTYRSSVFTCKDVIQAPCRLLPDGADVATIERYADRLLAADDVVAIGLPIAPSAAHGGGGDRSSRRYSTRELLALEADLLAHADATRDTGLAKVPAHIVGLACARNSLLSPARHRYARACLRSARCAPRQDRPRPSLSDARGNTPPACYVAGNRA